eukprot:3278263-Rhodomonas_salina.1
MEGGRVSRSSGVQERSGADVRSLVLAGERESEEELPGQGIERARVEVVEERHPRHRLQLLFLHHPPLPAQPAPKVPSLPATRTTFPSLKTSRDQPPSRSP